MRVCARSLEPSPGRNRPPQVGGRVAYLTSKIYRIRKVSLTGPPRFRSDLLCEPQFTRVDRSQPSTGSDRCQFHANLAVSGLTLRMISGSGMTAHLIEHVPAGQPYV